MKAAIYCRVSTEGQEQDGTSLQTQREACLTYCKARRYEVIHELSEACSGLTLDRPKLDELREMVRADKIDAVVVYSLDRFSRDPVHGVILMQELEKHGVALEAATETVDNSEVGKLVFYIKGYAAKLDAERRRDATGRGKQAALKAGKMPQGTGIGMYGYQWIKEYKKRTPIESEVRVVRRMFEMVADGVSCFRIAKTLNEEGIPTKSGKKWEARTVSSMVRNPAYIGITYFGRTSGKDRTKTPQDKWHVLKDVTPPIISKELFERAQDSLARSKELHPGKAKHEYPLSGFVYCSYCGSPLVGSCLSKRYRYYKCRGTYPTASRDKICDARYIRADWLEAAVWEKVKSVLERPEILLAEVKKQLGSEREKAENGNIDLEIKDLNRRLRKYTSQERRIMKAFKIGFTHDVVLDELNQMKRERQADTERLEALLQTKENINRIGENEAQLKELCSRIIPDLDNCTLKDKRNAFRYLDLKIKATPEGADIKGYVDPKLLTTG